MVVGLVIFVLLIGLVPRLFKALIVLFVLVAFIALAEKGHAATIYYGSRAGMEYTITATSGLDTAEAEIAVQHTRDNAIAYCRDYVQKVTRACIAQSLAEVPVDVTLAGNCETGDFTGFDGERYAFEGINQPAEGESAEDMQAPFRITRAADGEVLDGSEASGYFVALGIYRALCPETAPPDGAAAPDAGAN